MVSPGGGPGFVMPADCGDPELYEEALNAYRASTGLSEFGETWTDDQHSNLARRYRAQYPGVWPADHRFHHDHVDLTALQPKPNPTNKSFGHLEREIQHVAGKESGGDPVIFRRRCREIAEPLVHAYMQANRQNALFAFAMEKIRADPACAAVLTRIVANVRDYPAYDELAELINTNVDLDSAIMGGTRTPPKDLMRTR
ncbi:hypothetical protein DFH06DRAFT_646765 [Mycena polygramma]|nr:hypothetical protein DFH06DRAFT_646765 [Mycena polygramma]